MPFVFRSDKPAPIDLQQGQASGPLMRMMVRAEWGGVAMAKMVSCGSCILVEAPGIRWERDQLFWTDGPRVTIDLFEMASPSRRYFL